MSTRTLTALVLALVLLSGCNGVFDGGGPANTREPYSVPERYPPGVTGNGAVRTHELLSNHSNALQGESRTIAESTLVRYENGTLQTRSDVTGRIGPDGNYHAVQRIDGTAPVLLGASEGRIEWWSNGTVGVIAVTINGSTQYHPGVAGREPVRRYDQLYSVFATLDPELAGKRTLDGHEVFVLRANRSSVDVPFRNRFESVRNASFVAWVDDDGLVRGYRLTYTADLRKGNATVTVTERLRFRDVGSTTVPRPGWVDEAVETACRGPEERNRCRDRR